MKFSKLKMMAMVGAASVALLAGSQTANAQASATIATTFSTGAALAAANVSDFDFGEFVVNVGGTDQFNIVLAPTVAGTASPTTPACALPGTPDASSVCAELTAPASSGVVSVTSPVALEVQISGTVTTPFAEPALDLIDLTYLDSATPANTGTVPAAFTPSEVVEVLAPNTPEDIGIGATLRIGGAGGGTTPPASQTFADAVVTINFQF